MRKASLVALLCLSAVLIWIPGLVSFGSSTVEQAVDRDGNCIIDDLEILWAVEYWITGDIVPGTSGRTISDSKILELVGLWISGDSVCTTPIDDAPVITRTSCPAEIRVGQPGECWVGFSDSQGDIVEARFSKVAGDPGSYSYDPGVYGMTSGSFTFNIECTAPTSQQTLEITLYDQAGNRSEPAYVNYACAGSSSQDVATAFLAIINQYRGQSSQCWDMVAKAWVSWPGDAVRNLTLSTPLTDASIYHSRFMADHNCFKHVCSGEADLRTRIEQAGYTGWTSFGENIFAGGETPEEAFNAWRASSGHNQNMLSCQFKEIGVGRVYGAGTPYGWYWTTDFGSR